MAVEADRTALRATVETAIRLAREATNGWACYAKREIEHRDIHRLHTELDALKLSLAPPADPRTPPATEGEKP